MSNRLTRLFSRTPGQRRWRLALVITAALLVPLGVAGFVSAGLASADERVDDVPALIVNDDQMVTQTTPDGGEQPVLAGRLLVTQLTKKDVQGFDWQLSNGEEAAKALKDGSAYAVLTIPKDFSASIVSISGSDPRQADLRIVTDDAHSYLAGSVAQSIGDAMTGAFGREITKQYLTGFYANLAGMGGQLGTAADGAAQLGSGAGELASGLTRLSDGVAASASGAHDAATGASAYATGVDRYTTGVDGIASGLGQLEQSTAQLGDLSAGLNQAAAALQGLGTTGAELGAYLQAHPEILQQYPELGGIIAQLPDASSATGSDVVGGLQTAATGISSLQGGIARLADGAAALSAGSQGLRDGATGIASGVDQLADGLDQLHTGAAGAATGAGQLQGGATQLADGLRDGADKASALADIDAEKTAEVVSSPVSVATDRENAIDGIGSIIGMVFVPVSLWIGAFVIFLLMRPVTALALQSTASTPQLVVRSLGRAAGIAVGQAVLVSLLLHAALGVSWAMLPATLAFGVLVALVFVAVHHFLVVAFGRAGFVVSLLLVVVQLLASGALYPLQLVSAPFQAISPFLPLTWAVSGMQAIVAGVGGAVVAPVAVLALFGLLAFAGSLFAVSRKRGARSWGFAPARGY